MELIIGSHVSYKSNDQLIGSVKEAISYGANTFMFYTGAPQNTMRGSIDLELRDRAYALMKENNIDIDKVIVHAPYIVNLANTENFDFSVSFLKKEVERCSILGIKYMVLHPGSAVNSSREEALTNISEGLNLILDNNYNVKILLETMAGKGNEVGKTFDELKTIIDNVKYKDKIGVCLDTCHLNDAGYNIKEFDYILDDRGAYFYQDTTQMDSLMWSDDYFDNQEYNRMVNENLLKKYLLFRYRGSSLLNRIKIKRTGIFDFESYQYKKLAVNMSKYMGKTAVPIIKCRNIEEQNVFFDVRIDN